MNMLIIIIHELFERADSRSFHLRISRIWITPLKILAFSILITGGGLLFLFLSELSRILKEHKLLMEELSVARLAPDGYARMRQRVSDMGIVILGGATHV